ncbi:hypothetical protein [Streptomyces sp. S186]|uniref:hypothetical protein n=1 Tax=Streptomyces sp. S186 TaxID=3434395 RepID=UPI003F679C6C
MKATGLFPRLLLVDLAVGLVRLAVLPLAELRARVERLLDRIASNSRTTAAGLGTLDGSQVPSGYALKLALGPLDALVGARRLDTEHKYQLLLKMVPRLYQAGRAEGWPAGGVASGAAGMGAAHADRPGGGARRGHPGVRGGVLSLETAVGMLMDAGYPIKDASEEVARMRSAGGASWVWCRCSSRRRPPARAPSC